MVKLREIPEPILATFPRRPRPELKPLVSAQVPEVKATLPKIEPPPLRKPAGNEPAKKPQNPQETGGAPGNEPVKKKQQVEPSFLDDVPVMEIVDEKGNKVPPLYKPIPVLQALESANPTVLMVMLRQLRDMAGQMPDTSNGALAVITKLQHGLTKGEDITALNNQVAIHLTGQFERRELLNALDEALDDERKTEMQISRAKWEDFLHSCQRRSDLTIAEGMAVQAYFNAQLQEIEAKRAKKRAGGGEGLSRETHELVRAVNVPTQLQRQELEKKFNDATPQGREILRKLGFRIEQGILAARITKTTTETVEVVQKDGPDAAQ